MNNSVAVGRLLRSLRSTRPEEVVISQTVNSILFPTFLSFFLFRRQLYFECSTFYFEQGHLNIFDSFNSKSVYQTGNLVLSWSLTRWGRNGYFFNRAISNSVAWSSKPKRQKLANLQMRYLTSLLLLLLLFFQASMVIIRCLHLSNYFGWYLSPCFEKQIFFFFFLQFWQAYPSVHRSCCIWEAVLA